MPRKLPHSFYSRSALDVSTDLLGKVLVRRLRHRILTGKIVETDIASGPGKLCKAMSIDKKLNAEDLLGDTLWIEDRKLNLGTIRTSPRVGVDYAGEYKDKPWRFYVEGNPHVSKVRFK